MTEPGRSPPSDELTARYREASAQDTRRPGAHVRDAVRAHAQSVITASNAQGAPATGTTPKPTRAANQPRWKLSALASLALVGLTSLLVLQFERGTDEEKSQVFGQPGPSAPPAASSTPSTPALEAAPANSTTSEIAPPKSGAGASTDPVPAATLKAPAKPAPDKPATRSTATRQATGKAGADTAPSLESVAPSAAVTPPPPPAPAMTRDDAGRLRPPRMAGATPGAPAAVAPESTSPTDSAAAPPVAHPPPAAAAAAAPIAEPRQEKSAAPTRSLRAEATATLGLASALQQSARSGDLAQLERLLQQGAPLNAADAAGRTPLILAVMQGHSAVVQRLLAAGANTAWVDQDGWNALRHARQLGLDGIAHLIEAAR